MIVIKNKDSIRKMQEAGKLLSSIFDVIPSIIHAGMSTLQLDQWIEQQLCSKGLISKMKGYRGYRHVSCISINDEVVHGVPSEAKLLANGDVVKVDVCGSWKGYCADMARVFFIGDDIPDIHRKLALVAQQALFKGIEKACVGNRLSDISAAIQKEIEDNGFGVVRDFAGHGIGKQMHEDPEVLNYGKAGTGPVLQHGMAIAIEPMITLGNYDVYITKDGWTAKTTDKSLAVHVEDTVIITNEGPCVTTRNTQI
jgi:methionyl aminopeptidase